MKLGFFASLIVFVLVIYHNIRRSRKVTEKDQKSFWKKEAMANNTRRMPLDNLEYITIPLDSLPLSIMSDDPVVSECIETLRILSEGKIVNFTGISNTDLKLKYGAPNINLLADYDQNFTSLVRTLHKWADILYHNGYEREARIILEFAISAKSDISKSYVLLANIYASNKESSKIAELIPIAEALNSSLRGSIVRTLQEFDLHND